MDNWIEVYTTNIEYEALLIQGLLEENDIPTIIINQCDSMYKFGEIKIMVALENVETAKQLIEKDN